MGTRDGARFLQAQLDSLAAQTRRPDELVVVDDASTDGTVAMLETFASRAPFPMQIGRNPTRLGVAANFTAALGRCTGELVATCDQDDLWHPGRLARAEREFADPAVTLTFSDADLVDAEGRSMGRTLWRAVGFDGQGIARVRAGDPLAVLLGRFVVTGATMTVRREFASRVLPVAEGWLHDAWLAFFAAAAGRIVPMEERLIAYRQHGGNQIGAPQEGFGGLVRRAFGDGRSARVRAQLAQWMSLRERAAAGEPLVPRVVMERLDERIAHLSVRAGLGARVVPRLRAVMREVRTGRYAGNGNGHWSALQDIVG